ncbi:MAG: glycosyltransferase family 2 protein [Moorellales bacterium]
MPVTVVVPAYNEERTVGAVARTALAARPLVRQVIVVDDGSTDRTAVEARAAGAEVVVLDTNGGKALAVLQGVRRAKEDTLLFLDADLLGLRPEHLWDLALPVLEGGAHMSIGVFRRGRRATDLAQWLAPQLSGQRCLTRRLFEAAVPSMSSGFGLEKALNRYARQAGVPVVWVPMPGVTHLMKEEKRGLWKGIQSRLRMYLDLYRSPGPIRGDP